MDFNYGQKIRLRLEHKPEFAYVVSTEPNDEYILELSPVWPYDYEYPKCPSFFMHKEFLTRHIKKQHYGKQLKLRE